MTIYDSWNGTDKTPFGAVPAGETVTFTIHLPKSCSCPQPVLKLQNLMEDEALVIPLTLCRTDLTANHYTGTFTPPNACLYIYSFEAPGEKQLHSIRRGADGRGRLDSDGGWWQLTVYDPAMQPPGFLREGVMYQIFPDRFFASGRPKENIPADRLLREDWGGLPAWRPNAQGEVLNNDYFGGDLRGIQQKLPYLASLGVTALYLNPIFEAHSNHRYNTANYENIDPLLGNEADFRDLCGAAREYGIRIILDGVFSHTGSDSVYFNKEKRYGEGGAFHDENSPYRPWYRFQEDPSQYDCWWGFTSLPNVNEDTPSYLEFICGEHGVLRKWLAAGASGFRLDVADELPDIFLDRLHDCVKQVSPDAAILGEVWEDASNKESYGARRRYLLGKQLDSVMNYPFRTAILEYIRWGSHQQFYHTVMQILENYPKPAIQSLMNSLSTHDTSRAITELAGPLIEDHGRDWQEEHHHLPPEQYRHGCQLFKLASILQFGLPGIPCIYYGDEAGMYGYKDPFNRGCYPWGKENHEVLDFLRALGNIRREYPLFSQAEFLPLLFSPSICMFSRETAGMALVFAVNRSDAAQPLHLPPMYAEAEMLALTGQYQNGELGAFSGVVLRVNRLDTPCRKTHSQLRKLRFDSRHSS